MTIVLKIALCGSFNAKITVPSRAFENQVFMCYINRAGKESCPALNKELKFCGLSLIGTKLQNCIDCKVAPDGTELARANKTDHKLLVGELKKDGYEECKKQNPYFRDRRPELYKLMN